MVLGEQQAQAMGLCQSVARSSIGRPMLGKHLHVASLGGSVGVRVGGKALWGGMGKNWVSQVGVSDRT